MRSGGGGPGCSCLLAIKGRTLPSRSAGRGGGWLAKGAHSRALRPIPDHSTLRPGASRWASLRLHFLIRRNWGRAPQGEGVRGAPQWLERAGRGLAGGLSPLQASVLQVSELRVGPGGKLLQDIGGQAHGRVVQSAAWGGTQRGRDSGLGPASGQGPVSGYSCALTAGVLMHPHLLNPRPWNWHVRKRGNTAPTASGGPFTTWAASHVWGDSDEKYV